MTGGRRRAASSVTRADVGDRLDRLGELLRTAPLNLISRGERDRVREVHLDECWRAGELLPCAAGQQWVDLGTGGGLPGLVLALQYPTVSWTLVDATRKKAQAVRSFVRSLGVANVTVVEGRAESLSRHRGHRGRYDGVVSRAVAPLPALLELGRGFLRPGGWLVAIKGPAVERELAEARAILYVLGLELVDVRDVPDTVRPTMLVTMRAVGVVPPAVPRATGLPQHKPLKGR